MNPRHGFVLLTDPHLMDGPTEAERRFSDAELSPSCLGLSLVPMATAPHSPVGPGWALHQGPDRHVHLSSWGGSLCSLESPPSPPPSSLWLCDFEQRSEPQCPHQGEVQTPPCLCITTGWITAAQDPVLRILRLHAGSWEQGSIGDS